MTAETLIRTELQKIDSKKKKKKNRSRNRKSFVVNQSHSAISEHIYTWSWPRVFQCHWYGDGVLQIGKVQTPTSERKFQPSEEKPSHHQTERLWRDQVVIQWSQTAQPFWDEGSYVTRMKPTSLASVDTCLWVVDKLRDCLLKIIPQSC